MSTVAGEHVRRHLETVNMDIFQILGGFHDVSGQFDNWYETGTEA